MIVREFEHDPEMPFDFFNDYDNTLAYITRETKCRTDPEEKQRLNHAKTRLTERHEVWLKDFWKKR